MQLFVDRGLSGNSGYWLITKAEITGKATWNTAYTDHWPKEADKAPFIQGFRHLNGWEVTVHAQPKSMKESRGTPPEIFQVLIDKDRVIHWRNAWPDLPPGLQNLGQ
jgi:hypothetical protein